MPHLCPWDLSTMEYDSCCNHIAFIERVDGEEDGLTVEQIAEKQKEMDARQKLQSKITNSTAYFSFKLRDFAERQAQRRKYTTQRSRESVKASKKKSGAKAKATGQYRCEPCGKSFEDITALKVHKTSNKHRDTVGGVKKTVKLPYNKAWEANNIATKRYHCGTCDKSFGNSTKLNDHNNTDGHIDKVNGTTFHCGPCKRDFDTRMGFDRHNKQPGHHAKVAELAAASS